MPKISRFQVSIRRVEEGFGHIAWSRRFEACLLRNAHQSIWDCIMQLLLAAMYHAPSGYATTTIYTFWCKLCRKRQLPCQRVRLRPECNGGIQSLRRSVLQQLQQLVAMSPPTPETRKCARHLIMKQHPKLCTSTKNTETMKLRT